MLITPNETDKIQEIIDSCAKTGEEVVFKKGLYRTATLFLRDNSKIILEKGAMILGVDDFDAYSDDIDVFTDAVDGKRGKALIYAENASNISITGDGIINGNGKVFSADRRPFLIRIVRCNNVHIEGIQVHDSGAWNIHLMDSDNIYIKDLFIKSKVNSNNDGIDIDSCRNCRIEDCIIDSGDDAICLKSTLDKPCRDIYVNNCTLSTDWAGLKVGTESVGDFENVVIENTYIYNCKGCAIKIIPVDGGNLNNLTIRNVTLDKCTGPIFISNGERLREYHGCKREIPSTIKNVVIDNVKGTCVDGPNDRFYKGEAWGNAKSCICISGTKNAPVENVTISNIDVEMAGGVSEYEKTPVPEMGTRYPEFHNFGVLPAWGIYGRNIKGLKKENVNLTLREEDVREMEAYENVE
ncbi:MAG: right-handed parallel beta-helix repeat-containing protein [Clostridia bacterium]|nr:right-handed parallel beta-helix repeat-containing protein [Clostridia bacterium]